MWRKRAAKPDEDRRVVKDRERSRKRTMDRAVRLLAAKPRSVEELRERLLEKLWTDHEIVAAVIAKLAEYGYLDDRQYASDTALAKLRARPQGRRKLMQSMSRKQVERSVLEQAIDEAFVKMPESEMLDAAIEKRLRVKGVPVDQKELKKFIDHLMRQGFGYSMIRERLPAIRGEDASGD